MRHAREIGADAGALCREAWASAKRGRWCLFGLALVVAVAVNFWTYPNDRAWLDALANHDTPEGRAFARKLSWWGDFLTGSLGLAGVLWLVGKMARKRVWQTAALACLLASATAGMTANLFRLTLGRPRPATDVPDRFYGLVPSHKYHSFPSGHSATACGSAAALAVALPVVGVPALAAAGGVVWSRMYLKQHFPSDVLVGGCLGILAGACFGAAARRLSRQCLAQSGDRALGVSSEKSEK